MYYKSSLQAATAMGIRLSMVPVRSESDLSVAFAKLERDRPDALGVSTTGVLSQHIDRVIEFAAQLRLPTLYSTPGAVRRGGLMSYGADFSVINRRIAAIVDKILKGTRPGDIPVEEPAKFLLIVNKKTARAMGLTIPEPGTRGARLARREKPPAMPLPRGLRRLAFSLYLDDRFVRSIFTSRMTAQGRECSLALSPTGH